MRSSTPPYFRGIAQRRTPPTSDSPNRGAVEVRLEQLGSSCRIRVGTVPGAGRTSVRGGYGMGYERNFGNVTYNDLFNPPKYLVAPIDAGLDVATMPSSSTMPARSAVSPVSRRPSLAAACAIDRISRHVCALLRPVATEANRAGADRQRRIHRISRPS